MSCPSFPASAVTAAPERDELTGSTRDAGADQGVPGGTGGSECVVGKGAGQASSKIRTAMVPWVTAAPAPRPAATMTASAIWAFEAPAFLALVTCTSRQ